MIVIDTHALIWFMQGDETLGPDSRQLVIERAASEVVLVSAMTFWEAALLAQRGRIDLGEDSLRWSRRVLATPGFAIAPIEPEIATDAVALRWGHKDPADRMIVATARHWRVPLLTVDRAITGYAGLGHLTVIDASR